MLSKFQQVNLQERDLQEDLDVRWEDNIRMHHKEIGINMKNWVDLTQDRDYLRALVNAALILRVS